MKLKLDENLNERGIALLAGEGHDVSTVVRQQMQAATDGEVIEACRQEGRALVTLDLDFANPLHFQPSKYPGIAVLRLPKQASCRRSARGRPHVGGRAETQFVGRQIVDCGDWPHPRV